MSGRPVPLDAIRESRPENVAYRVRGAIAHSIERSTWHVGRIRLGSHCPAGGREDYTSPAVLERWKEKEH